MVTEIKQNSLKRLHQAHLMCLVSRTLLKEKELSIHECLYRGNYNEAVQEKKAYRQAVTCLLESLDILKQEYGLMSEQDKCSEIGCTLSRIVLEFENLEQLLTF
jgi:hypothetical protein